MGGVKDCPHRVIRIDSFIDYSSHCQDCGKKFTGEELIERVKRKLIKKSEVM